MVGSLVRFLFTCCEESQTHSFAALTRSFAILHNSSIKIVRTHPPWSNFYILRVCKYFGYPKEQLTKLFDLLIMSLFLYGIEIWGAAYQGKYLDRIDKFIKQAFRFRYTNRLYATAEVIRNWDCKLWNTITDTPSHPLYQLLLPKKQRFLWNRGHDFIVPAVIKTECFKRYFSNRCLFNFI